MLDVKFIRIESIDDIVKLIGQSIDPVLIMLGQTIQRLICKNIF